jgi:hypothetical protein
MPLPTLIADAAPIPKDVVLAIFGAAAGVAGLILVFLGVVLSTVGSYPGDTPDAVRRPFRRAAWATTFVFALSLATVGLSLGWLTAESGVELYYATISLFSLVLVLAFSLALAVVHEII